MEDGKVHFTLGTIAGGLALLVIVLELSHFYLGVPNRSLFGSLGDAGSRQHYRCHHDGVRWVGC